VKQSKLIIILLIVLIGAGWLGALTASNIGEGKEYKEHLKMAKEYMNRGLYQKAIGEYDAAIGIKDKEETWTAMLDAYQKRYGEDPGIYEDYLTAAQGAVSSHSKNADYLLTLANLYMSQEEYKDAYRALEKAVDGGMKDKKVKSLLSQVKYAYDLEWNSYTDYRTCLNGYYAVSDMGVWTYIEENGGETSYGGLTMAGSIGEDGIRVVANEKRGELIDGDGIVQGILPFIPVDSGVYSEGLVAVFDGKTYSYYNSLGDKQFGDYEKAGAFVNGEAAVQKNNKWYIIDTQGKKARDTVYEDIVLQANGTHIKNDVMIAKKDGKYTFYHEKKNYGSFDDVDIITDDELIAVCKAGKWGFVDLEGKEVIKPTYKGAKSFSNGIAAVTDGTLWGFIDASGNMIINYSFADADYFNAENRCMVKSGMDSWQMMYFRVEE